MRTTTITAPDKRIHALVAVRRPLLAARDAHDRLPIAVRVVHVPPTYPPAVWTAPKRRPIPAESAAAGDSRRERVDATTTAQPWITARKVWTTRRIVQNSRLDASCTHPASRQSERSTFPHPCG